MRIDVRFRHIPKPMRSKPWPRSERYPPGLLRVSHRGRHRPLDRHQRAPWRTNEALYRPGEINRRPRSRHQPGTRLH